ncbi:CHAD domain-containing protein [Tunturiibacter gelidiferens]|uniref:CHAD domain-containing protein n=1 Tax=Tunturiibacter gelidiferens TaxID=3069689 RepID=UPI003D9BCF9F
MPQPVMTFFRHSLDLKAALADCVDDPKPRAVHRLRSSTRRLEAVLEVLANAAELPDLAKRSKQFRRSLGDIRRSAGAVRDLDVHVELLKHLGATDGVVKLEKELQSSRKKKVKKLQRRIRAGQDEIHGALDRVEMDIAGQVDLNLSGAKLINVARSWMAPEVHGLDPSRDEDLHSIRKVCKTARYMAEIGSEASKAAAKFAKRLEDVQQTTGAWHDYLLLLNHANARLPQASAITEKLYAKAGLLRRQAESKAAHLLKA